jgi:hypothetical protein
VAWEMKFVGGVATIVVVSSRTLEVAIVGTMSREDVRQLRDRLNLWLDAAYPLCPRCAAIEATNQALGHHEAARRGRRYCLSEHDPMVMDRP